MFEKIFFTDTYDIDSLLFMQNFMKVRLKMPEIFPNTLGGGLEIWASIYKSMSAILYWLYIMCSVHTEVMGRSMAQKHSLGFFSSVFSLLFLFIFSYTIYFILYLSRFMCRHFHRICIIYCNWGGP